MSRVYFGIEVVRHSDGGVERFIPFAVPRGERLAEKTDDGLNRNLNHEDYFTRMVAEPHSKTPWAVDTDGDIMAANGPKVADMAYTTPRDRAFIVRACNAHDALLSALRALVALHEDGDGSTEEMAFQGAVAAIALAETE